MSELFDAFQQSDSVAVIIATLVNHVLIWREGRFVSYYSSFLTLVRRPALVISFNKSPELAEFNFINMRFVWMAWSILAVLLIVRLV